MRENEFQGKLIRELKELFPGCIVLKNDAGYIQGIPDLIILYHDKWAALECKKKPSGFHLRRFPFASIRFALWVKSGSKPKIQNFFT